MLVCQGLCFCAVAKHQLSSTHTTLIGIWQGKGARIWIPDPNSIWKAAEVVKDYKDKQLVVEDEDGEQETLEVPSDDKLPPLRNPEILIGENDLTSLSYLHEPAGNIIKFIDILIVKLFDISFVNIPFKLTVLYNLQVRFCNQNAIYTYCGIVLVAINPYEELPIYSNDTILAYRGQAMGDLDPHIFAVSEEAYTQMERESQNQSIIVSGESGAGKTVSAKYAMRYFATVGGSTTETQIEKKVLASNPIMEAIGNAKTTRNDNSSRFGKYTEIDFNKTFFIMGASMRTYLLEKSRVVFQAPDERNYHIFYQLCSSAHLDEFKYLQLRHQDYFQYTSQGDSAEIDGVDDAISLENTRAALSLLGFSEDRQSMIFRVLACVLHMGNIEFIDGGTSEEDAESSGIKSNDSHLIIICDLLGIDIDQMRMWLCNRKIESMKEIFTKPMTKSNAMFARDALAKHIYARLFDWIVSVVNKSLASNAKHHKFIGVLDIYGFETFEINSFEQFCINYANEKLQQQFNQHVFKLEQEEYVREKIEWKFIDFYDNQPCIDLIESKLGVLDLLDEECRMPKGSDQSWCMKLYDKCKKWPHFAKPRLSNTAYIIVHFADRVQYEITGFLDKNRDTVMEEHINILKASQHGFVSDLFMESKTSSTPKAKSSAASSRKEHKKTVGSQFRSSLGLLMSTLNSTTPHYIRCIKPNDVKEAFKFDPKRAVQQLRACGVLETVRISAAGYPSRWTYQEFLNRYRVLTRSKDIKRGNLKDTCAKILENVIKDEDKFQFGKTKIFFRAGQVAYLEKLRADKLRACAIMVQKHVRGWLLQHRYQKMRSAAICIQRFSRGLLARRLALFKRQTNAAIIMQKITRGYLQKKKFTSLRFIVTRVQSLARGKWARERFEDLRRNANARIIQKYVKGWLARIHYAKAQKAIVLLQSCVRRMYAKREFKKLKIEAKSVEHIKKLNKGLENKIISLQQKIGEINKENKSLKSETCDNVELKKQVKDLKCINAEFKGSSNRIKLLEESIAALRAELEQEKSEKKDIISEKELLQNENENLNLKYNEDNCKLREELDKANMIIKSNLVGAEETLKERIENEKRLLNEEFNDERTAYQKLLQEHSRLEQRYENLQGEMEIVRGSGLSTKTHRRVASDVSVRSDVTEIVRDDISDVHDESDIGYGSARSKENDPSRLKLDDINWDQNIPAINKESPDSEESSEKQEDVGMILKLQRRLKDLQADKNRLEKKLEGFERSEESPRHDLSPIDGIKINELQIENNKMKEDLLNLRKAATEGTDNEMKEFMAEKKKKILCQIDAYDKEVSVMLFVQQSDMPHLPSVAMHLSALHLCHQILPEVQFEAVQEELDRRRQEIIQLKSSMANNLNVSLTQANDLYSSTTELNADGELVMAFESQKKVIRQMENELGSQKSKSKQQEDSYKLEIKKLLEDNERQQKLLSDNLQKTPQDRTEAVMQHEITRLTGENLDLREKIDGLQEHVKKLKKQLKIYVKKLKESGEHPGDLLELQRETSKDNMPVVKHKDVEYLGMFEYKKDDEPAIVRSLIYDLRPKLAITLLPGLPAYILFMCIRHTDYINDDEKVKALLSNTVNGIRRVVKKRHEDMDTVVLWLANTCRLLHNLKQYSGDKAFQTDNTIKQNEQCLRNFDLSEYRQVLSDIAVWIYQAVIKLMEEKVQSLIVPAILEHDAIPGISGKKPLGMRGRSSSVAKEVESPCDPIQALETLMNELTHFHKVLNLHGVDPELVSQVFNQIFYFICAGSLNNLLLRKDMCHWSKGMQIRYNLSHLEQWCRDMKLQQCGTEESLKPIIQASQLLQARKSNEDVKTICDMCHKLTNPQIVKILNLYTPADDYEERVPISFIRKIQSTLAERPNSADQSKNVLLMDTKFAFPVRFPFNPSNIQLEDIVIPEATDLIMLKKV
ncbi:Unconventional myosin-Va [Nymphon striatum]|nr:Unconventional myosin-Va [Nymphon striatum]